MGLNGSVQLSFIITKEGVVKDIIVTKGVDIALDKEAVRVIRKLKFSAPSMLKGEPVEVCIKMPMSFRMM